MNAMNKNHESYQPPNSSNTMSCRQIINRVKRLFPQDKVEMKVNFHYVYGFITLTDGRMICVFSSDERYFGNISEQMIFRTAKDKKDHSGGINNRFDINSKTLTREDIVRRLYGYNQNNAQMV